METIQSLVLGVIEGLTEFLPVSSTGHMIIAQPLLGIDPEDPKWRVFLFVSQMGAILAVVLYFWRDLWRRTFHPRSRSWKQHIATKLTAALVPTIVLGLAFDDFMEKHLEGNPTAVAGALIVGALLMLFIDAVFRRRSEMNFDDITLRQAFLIGLAQCLSMWPGTSRAAATIMGGMVLGLTPRVAAQFSFYLAIPTMVAAGGYRLWKYRNDLTMDMAGMIATGTAAAFLVALFVVAAFMNYVQRRRFTPFAVYRILLGAAVLILTFLTDLFSRSSS